MACVAAFKGWSVFWMVWWSGMPEMPAYGSIAGVEPVTLQLKWKHQFQFAGYYAAVEKGFYAEAGLDVTLREVEEGENPVDAVLEEKAEFGIAASDLILHRSQGKPVVALAAIFQHSPNLLLARRDRGIEGVHDLSGKRIMLEPQAADLLAYLKSEGVTPEKFIIIDHTFDIEALASGQVDAMTAYVSDELFPLREAGIDAIIIDPKAGGYDFYGDTLFTTEAQTGRRYRDRTRRFVEASLRGWEYAMQHPEEIIDLILTKYSRRHSREHLLFEAHAMQRLMRTDLVSVGHMYAGRWEHIASVYMQAGLMTNRVSIAAFAPDRHVLPGNKTWYWIALALTVVLLLVLMVALRMRKLNRLLNATNRQLLGELKMREQFILMLDSIPECIYVSDLKTNEILFANQELKRQLKGDPTGQQCFKAIQGLAVPCHFCTNSIIARQDTPHCWEYYNPTTGKHYYVIDKALSWNDGRAARFELAIDISRQKAVELSLRRSEEKYRVLTETMKDVVWILDTETYRFVYVSPSVFRLRGYTPEEIMAETLDAALDATQKEMIRGLIDQNVKDMRAGQLRANDFVVSEVLQPCKDGSSVWTEVITHYLKDEETGKIMLHGVTRDISDRKKAEAQLLETNRQLGHAIEEAKTMAVRAEAANVAKSQFLANMSHEIRTPLNAIIGFADLLARDVPDEQQRQHAGIVAKSGQSLSRLINDILDISKIEAGKLDIVPTPFNVDAMIEEMRQLFELRAREKGVELCFDRFPGVPGLVRLDAIRLRQILVNLIGNALKFTENGRVTVTVNAMPSVPATAGEEPGEPGLTMQFTVTDTGIGIPDAYKQRIFEVFEQVPGLDRNRFGGTGLGLAISQRLAGLMKGEIIAQDGSGGCGATFVLTLREVPVVAWPAGTLAVVDGDEQFVFASPPLTLIVDDVADNRELLRSCLAPLGFSIAEAQDGHAAREIFLDRKPGLVLVDIKMAAADGRDFARFIRAQADPGLSRVPVVAVTASPETSIDGDDQTLFDAVLMKPVSLNDLLGALARFVKHEVVSRSKESIVAVAGSEVIARIPEDERAALRTEIEDALKTQRIRSVVALGRRLAVLGEQLNETALVLGGNELAAAAEKFQIATMQSLLARWQKLFVGPR